LVIHLTNDDSYTRGVEYLRVMQTLLPDPAMVDVMDNLRDRATICTWIGTHIWAVNEALQQSLLACHECFHPEQRRCITIYATPIAQAYRLDGLCNIATTPTTILIDAGRVAPEYWLSLVAHEYAHAHLGSPGHHQKFAAILSHLCLGLGLEPPRVQTEESLRSHPPYVPTHDPLAFWRGETMTLHPHECVESVPK
jgi:hypothetical protein